MIYTLAPRLHGFYTHFLVDTLSLEKCSIVVACLINLQPHSYSLPS